MKIVRGLSETGCGLAIGLGILAFVLTIISGDGTMLRKVAEYLGWSALGALILGIVCACVRDGIKAAKENE